MISPRQFQSMSQEEQRDFSSSKEFPATDLQREHEVRERIRDAAPAMLNSIGPSDGGTASFPDELDVVAGIIDRYDARSGLGRHLRARAAKIRAVLAEVQGKS
jgi:hypothetical protein